MSCSKTRSTGHDSAIRSATHGRARRLRGLDARRCAVDEVGSTLSKFWNKGTALKNRSGTAPHSARASLVSGVPSAFDIAREAIKVVKQEIEALSPTLWWNDDFINIEIGDESP